MSAQEVVRGVYEVAGPDLTGGGDASAYLILFEGEAALIDAGADPDARALIANLDPLLAEAGASLELLVLTHNHIDHVGGAAALKQRFGLEVVMHQADAPALEKGDIEATGADMYNTTVRPVEVDLEIEETVYPLELNGGRLTCLHTPGHTPGSISVLLERDGDRILFGQDIHGPFLPRFNSDLDEWRLSMMKLLKLKCDVLCEGHFGVVEPAEQVDTFIKQHLRANT